MWKLSINVHSATAIAKIKEMSQSLFYDIPGYITMDYEKWYICLLLAQCEVIYVFEIQNHVNDMYISRFRCGVDLLYFLVAFLGEALRSSKSTMHPLL